MTDRKSLTPEDRKLFDLLEYQAGKFMDEAVLDGFPNLVSYLIEEGDNYPEIVNDHRAGMDILADDVVGLPDGGFVCLTWELKVLTKEEVEKWIGESIEQIRQG